MNIYTHNKTGVKYILLSQAIDCTNERTGAPTAIYCKAEDTTVLYVRDFFEFKEKFTLSEDVYNGSITFDVVRDYYCK